MVTVTGNITQTAPLAAQKGVRSDPTPCGFPAVSDLLSGLLIFGGATIPSSAHI